MNLWGGRFRRTSAPEFSKLNNSFRFDHRLVFYDIDGSIAYSKALHQAGVLKITEAAAIQRALRSLEKECAAKPQSVLDALEKYEDVHSFVEAKLVERVGEIGKKIHTGRSRNDQVSTDFRLYIRGQCQRLRRAIASLMRVLLLNAQRDLTAILPGYTHLQRAQPILFAHYWMAYFEMFSRDLDRLASTAQRANVMPLGSGALAGSGFPIDRDFLARELGFNSVTANSLDAVSDRDYVVEFLSASSILMMHLSRLAEDLILYSTAEFDFIELNDALTSGSSLMPQKKNPDALELTRGKTGRVYGNLHRLLVTLKALPLAYNKDLQEDKEPVFDTVDTLDAVLPAMIAVIRTLRVKRDKMRQTAGSGFLNATDCADYLVRKGLPFRAAHEIVGRIVLHALRKRTRLEQLSLEEFRSFTPDFGPDVFKVIELKKSIEGKSVKGGTATRQVQRAIQDAKRYLNQIQ